MIWNKENLNIITTQKMMIKKIEYKLIILLLILSVFYSTSCKNQDKRSNVYLYRNIVPSMEYNVDLYIKDIPYSYPVIPVVFKLSNTSSSEDPQGCKDHAYEAIIDPKYLYKKALLISPQDYKEYMIGLYDSLVKNNNILNVDSTLFYDSYLRSCRFSVDSNIKQIYDKEGILPILNMYLKENGEIASWIPNLRFGSDSVNYTWHGKKFNYKYIISLAAKHNIYFKYVFHLPDEPEGYYISRLRSDNDMIKNILK